IRAIQVAFGQLVTHEETRFVRKENINVSCKNESSTRSANADVFGNHLKKRKLVRVRELLMDLAWNRHDTNFARPAVFGPAQLFLQGFPISRWIPFHQDEFSAEFMPFALGNEAIH